MNVELKTLVFDNQEFYVHCIIIRNGGGMG